MKSVLLLATVVAFVPAALAGSVRSVTASAPVLAVAFDGSLVAYASGRSAADCNRVYVWNLSTRGVSKLGRKTHCEQTSTGNAIAAVSIAGTRVLWVHYAGGNFRDWTLWTATTSRPSPTRLRLVSREAEAPAPIVVGDGDGSRFGDMLPYAVDRTVVVLRIAGNRRFAWTAPARVVALSAHAGELAVATEGGLVTVLDGAGKVLRAEEYAGEIASVRLTGSGLFVQRGRLLELRGTGPPRTRTVAAGSVLQGASGDRAFTVLRGQVHELSLSGSLDRIVAAGVRAAVEGGRLATASSRTVRVIALP